MTSQTETTQPEACAEAGGQVERVVIRCPQCGSAEVGHFRMDSDWVHGGDWTKVNRDDLYTKDELRRFDSNEWPDVECSVCCVCGQCF